jgi:hypothetical protein
VAGSEVIFLYTKFCLSKFFFFFAHIDYIVWRSTDGVRIKGKVRLRRSFIDLGSEISNFANCSAFAHLFILVKGYFLTVIASVSQRLPWRPPRHAVPQAREAIL